MTKESFDFFKIFRGWTDCRSIIACNLQTESGTSIGDICKLTRPWEYGARLNRFITDKSDRDCRGCDSPDDSKTLKGGQTRGRPGGGFTSDLIHLGAPNIKRLVEGWFLPVLLRKGLV